MIGVPHENSRPLFLAPGYLGAAYPGKRIRSSFATSLETGREPLCVSFH
jgi:hypothetical protein